MVRIRLRKMGLRHQPSYRIIVADKESPRDGRFLEVVGTYNPRTEPSTILVEEARIYYWLQTGAQPSESVARLLNQIGLTARFDRLKKGEPEEKLLQEAVAALAARPVSAKTRRETTPVRTKPKKKKEAS
jgi:small subunit ribosomal protein S16